MMVDGMKEWMARRGEERGEEGEWKEESISQRILQ